MRKVLIIGDSVSLGYTPAVVRELLDLAEVVHNPGNGGDSANVLRHVDSWLAEARPHLVVLNCGLHDIKRDRATRAYQVPLESYRANLKSILARIRAEGARATWVSTTPLIEHRHQAAKDFDRYLSDIDAYNAAAREIAGEHDAPVIDLHAAAMEMDLDEALADDGVHFTAEAYETLGRFVAESVRRELACD